MINFIACIDFKGFEKKNIHLQPHSLNGTQLYDTHKYIDDIVFFEHNGAKEDFYIWKDENREYLIFSSIFEEDRIALTEILGVGDDLNVEDSELMLKLYLKFGNRGLKYLTNGFVFILIDLLEEKVLAFRDHIGIKNICYLKTDSTIYLSSSFKNLFRLKDQNFSLNLNKIENFLNFNDASITNTFINEINKVPPLHFIEFSCSNVKVIEYSNYQLKDNLCSPIEQINGLREIILKSVSVDGSGRHSKIGFLFSGGLDSSTIITFFRMIKSRTHEIFSFSSNYKSIDKSVLHLIDESSYQDEINKFDDLNSISFDGRLESTLSDLDFYLEVIAQPFFFPNLYVSNKSFALARDSGVSLVMNGNDGDTVISHGNEYLLELFFSLKWIRLYKEIHKISIVRSQSKRFIFKRIILNQLSLRNFQNRSAQTKHLSNILTSSHSKAIEIQSLLATYYGLEERYPFYNRELIEYCLNISPHLKNKEGFSRYVLREAVKGVVPEKIRKRVTKSNLAHSLCLSFVDKDFKIIEEHLNNPDDIISELIDINVLKNSWEDLKKNPRKHATRSVVPSKIFSYVVLNRWLAIYRKT